MKMSLNKLLSVASDPLLGGWGIHEEQLVEPFGTIGTELLELLRCKNGFYAFESALHVIPLGSSPDHLNLAVWNDPQTWRGDYGDLIPMGILFFAEDAYGNQFGIMSEGVVLFYAEFAEIEPVAKSIREWGEVVLADWRGFSGYELAHAWQIQHRPLAEGERLVPKVPFVIGGKYELDNLYAAPVIDAMRFRGSLARQLAKVPDGTPIDLKIT
jgi:hypothetical protein